MSKEITTSDIQDASWPSDILRREVAAATDARRKRVNEMEKIEAELRRRDKIIFDAVSFLLGVVDLGAELDEKRVEHIDQVNSLIKDMEDEMEDDDGRTR